MIEEWRTLIPDFYEVSNTGKVKSLSRRILGDNGDRLLKTKEKKSFKDGKGYLTVKLHVNNESSNYKVHRLVASAFIENPKELPQVNHIDGDKLNNNVYNLEWCNNFENHKHAQKLGLIKTKLSEEDILLIRELINEDFSNPDISKIFNVHRSTIYNIRHAKRHC